MVLLQLAPVRRQVAVVEEVVRQVVAHVAEDAAAVRNETSVPVPEDDGLGKLPEWRSKGGEESRRHDKAILVHGKVVVDAVKHKVQSDANAVVGEVPRKY